MLSIELVTPFIYRRVWCIIDAKNLAWPSLPVQVMQKSVIVMGLNTHDKCVLVHDDFTCGSDASARSV
jgi:hypothetical protein